MNAHYDVILEQDVFSKLKNDLNFDQQLVQWDGKIVEMRPTKCTQETSYYVNNMLDIAAKRYRISKTLDAKYQLADLDKVTAKTKI